MGGRERCGGGCPAGGVSEGYISWEGWWCGFTCLPIMPMQAIEGVIIV